MSVDEIRLMEVYPIEDCPAEVYIAAGAKLNAWCELALQRYLMQCLVKAPFPVREIGPVLTLLHAGHVS